MEAKSQQDVAFLIVIDILLHSEIILSYFTCVCIFIFVGKVHWCSKKHPRPSGCEELKCTCIARSEQISLAETQTIMPHQAHMCFPDIPEL